MTRKLNEDTHKKRWSQLSLAGLDRGSSPTHRGGTSKRRHNSRQRRAYLALLAHWAKRIVDEVLGKERAAYGQQIVVSGGATIGSRVIGPSFGEKPICAGWMQFAEVFLEEEIVVSLLRQLSWTHFS